eukprot:6090081-Pleurochrysis_carterae.AAC.3
MRLDAYTFKSVLVALAFAVMTCFLARSLSLVTAEAAPRPNARVLAGARARHLQAAHTARLRLVVRRGQSFKTPAYTPLALI